ncbi:MAG: hypothetical protein GXX91_02785 [Verrucomicrobiaceae bacterium]|nr:hypothetical protein [Verrucomicrobiaceae bacterium]
MNEPRPIPDSPARTQSLRRLRGIGRLAGLVVFLLAVFLSGRIGVEMARNRLPDKEQAHSTLENTSPLTVGRSGDPVYLAQSPDSLRAFFARHPTPEDRASADLSGLGIRRLQDSVEMSTLRAEADAVEVKVSSGAIAGAIYWIHYTQLPDASAFDPIITPLPSDAPQ